MRSTTPTGDQARYGQPLLQWAYPDALGLPEHADDPAPGGPGLGDSAGSLSRWRYWGSECGVRHGDGPLPWHVP